nr:protein phosphatase 1B isoform X1 [Drosophila bipectinata]XP_017101071.1 protein phosphatase 1B isoform X1 [Drosophila bipectinata]XP_017101072.1 protein phosphatase 1B isoform X1 [Drosophila bipectinata]XP_017101073.1 protein phosphatase 1B isoform X1 [Drosophila bipectinata]XP_017101075.1 protein phosphatase 1B isoform X1 [Drosophila bipectinata]XP_017101076.1 protein phosphatase 1B isoform X1 [Drosophila bipectinata]
MGGFLDKPNTAKHNDEGAGNKLLFGVSSMQGWRCEMEDAYYARAGLGNALDDWSFFAVFDGHAGCKVSEHCAKHLLDSIVSTDEFIGGDHVKGIRTGFLRIDEVMRDLPEFTMEEEKCGGTTAVCAFVSSTQVYIANCGDSRAVLCRQGVPVFATQDHKPILPEEKERIHNAGGSVMIKRVNGTLAVSRALGDYDFKNVKEKGQCEQLVSPEPEIFCQSRQDTDEFLVLACDGIWDVMTNEDVCSFIHSRMRVTSDLVNIANQVVDTCLHKGSRDNMSIIIIAFPGAPKPTMEAIEAENRLEKQIEKITRDEIESSKVTDYVDLLKCLQNRDDIEGLPPGGGLQSKYHVIERTFKQEFPDRPCEKEPISYFIPW